MTIVSDENLVSILEKAVWSPAGTIANRGYLNGMELALVLFFNSLRAQHPLDPHGVASRLSLGCLITAIEVAASNFQLGIQITIENLAYSNKSVWAKIYFSKREMGPSPLSPLLRVRATDRRKYKGGTLDLNFCDESLINHRDKNLAQLHVASKPSKELKNYIVNSEQLLMDHNEILPATLKWVRFSKKQAETLRDGMPWSNLEINWWELPILPLLRDFPAVLKIVRPMLRIQNRLRLKKQLNSAAALVCVSVPKGDLSSAVDAGRLMMLAWLSLTQKGYGAQPFTIASTISYCVQQDLIKLPDKWNGFFKKERQLLKQEFSIPAEREPFWILRTGVSEPLPQDLRTYRMNISDILKIKK